MTLYFPHIPKCGGTTVRSFIQGAELNCFFDYEHPPSPFKYFEARCARRNNEFKQIDFSSFDLVYGHYPLKRYNHGNQIILLLRHPLDRAISHYNYIKYLMPRTNLAAMERNRTVKKVKDGEMGIVEFSRVNKIDTLFERYIGDISPENCTNVFFTDQLDELFKFLNDTFKLNLEEPEPERVNLEKSGLSSSEEDALNHLLSSEVEKYNLFAEHWKKTE